jgi:hypothetical protein
MAKRLSNTNPTKIKSEHVKTRGETQVLRKGNNGICGVTVVTNPTISHE